MKMVDRSTAFKLHREDPSAFHRLRKGVNAVEKLQGVLLKKADLHIPIWSVCTMDHRLA